MRVLGIGLAASVLAACGSSSQQGHRDDASVTSDDRSDTAGGDRDDAVADAATDTPALSCEYLFESHPVGTTWPSSDGCNTCSCDQFDGAAVLSCTDRNCWMDAGQVPCTFGINESCNEDPLEPLPVGICNTNGTCTCGALNVTSPVTGRCLRSYARDANVCEYGGGDYHVGTEFQCAASCDVCHCDAPGQISRKAAACDPAAGRYPCQLDSTYVYGTMGGSAPTSEVSVLGGKTFFYGHQSTRFSDGQTNSCYPQSLLPCGTPDQVDVGDILLDLMDPAVAMALGARPAPVLFGLDTRAAGTPLMFIHRADGGELLVGAPCAGALGCTEIPPGVARLAADLTTYDQQAQADRECSPWPQPGKIVCDNLLCTAGAEYCAKAEANGAKTFAMCRPYPAGCTTCACLKADVAPLTPPGCPSSLFSCSDLDGPVTTISCTNG